MAKIALYLTLLIVVAVIAGSNAQWRLCPRNQVFSEFPSSCPATCSQPNGPELCIQISRPPGCVCRYRYVLDGNNCVRLRDCPRVGK